MLLITGILAVSVSSTQGAKLGEHLSLTFTERFRLVTWDNAITLDEAAGATRTFTRHRTQLGVFWTPRTRVTVGLQLANEFRYYAAPSTVDFNLDEVFVDQAYLKLSDRSRELWALTFGRQNIMLGEGFIVMDGHPLDGSRSIYFNAVRFDWRLGPKHRLTAFVSYQEETDTWLPIVHDQDQALVEQPETGVGIYYGGQRGGVDIDGFVVFKRRTSNDSFAFDASTAAVGGRTKAPITATRNLSVVIEAAYQFGECGDHNRRAYGGYAYLEILPHWQVKRWYLPTALTAGVIVLSGDDPETENREDWDPMFARWPKWSESYIYTQINEHAVAWWSNLISLNTTARFALSSRMDFRFDYHHLTAPELSDGPADFAGGKGRTRGDLFIGKLTFRIDHNWTGHLLWEGFMPGDFYFDGADPYAWIRAELMYQY